MEQKLYKMSLLHSSNATYSVFLECKLVAPEWYASISRQKKFRCPSGDCSGYFISSGVEVLFGKCSDDIFKNTIGHFDADNFSFKQVFIGNIS